MSTLVTAEGTGRPARASGIKDVAARASVSIGTVSNVLNRPDSVSPQTRARVEQAMAELGYVRNEAARQLRLGRSRSLAYVMLDVSNPFFTDVAQGIGYSAEGAGLSLFLCDSDGRATRERTHLDHLVEQRVRGILITPVDVLSPTLMNVQRAGIPIVVVDRTPQDRVFCSVAVNDVLGGSLAVAHLVDRGHTRVAFVGGPMSIGQVRDRLEGAQSAWRDAGLPAEDLSVVEVNALTVAEGRAAGERIAGLAGLHRPSAVFCANDLLALGLLQQSVTSGFSVPGDLAIVGYDDIEFAAAAAVPLTSVRQPRQQLGRTAAELLIDDSQNPNHAHQEIVFEPELVARVSTLGSITGAPRTWLSAQDDAATPASAARPTGFAESNGALEIE